MAIDRLTLSYPDFVLNTVIDPDQIDTNNLEIVTKTNLCIDQENINTDKLAIQDINIANTMVSVATANIKSDNANTKADGAIVTANNADTKATSAVSTANSASTSASASITIATDAKNKAIAVETDYNAVKPTLLQAVIDVASKVNKSYVDGVASNFTLGIILDNSIGNSKMSPDMKKGVVGGVASQNDLLILNGSNTLKEKANKEDLTTLSTSVSASLADMSILTPTGTANTIVLPVTLANKKKYSFKATANSTSTVTINGISFKKLDGTAIGSGGVKANKVYDFYYDSGASSVFILAKAEGDSLVGDVLAGKIFSNGDDTGLIGAMINRAGSTTTIIPNNTDQTVPEGYYDGTADSGIVKGLGITVGENILFNDARVSWANYSSSPIKVKEIRFELTATYRIKFSLKTDSTYSVYGQIYKNGVVYGTFQSTNSKTGIIYTEDLSFSSGDTMQIYLSAGAGGRSGSVFDLQVCCSIDYPKIELLY